MNSRRKDRLPESYAHLHSHAVEVPILTIDGTKFWLVFYGLTSQDLVSEHVRTAMERRGLEPNQYWVTAHVWENAA